MSSRISQRMASVLPASGVLALLTLAGSSQTAAQEDESIAGPFSVDRALTLVYGGPTWQDAELRIYPDYTNNRAFVEQLFDAAYVEDGVEKHIVIATLTPRPRSQHSCHACSPLLGGAVLRAVGDAWALEAPGRIIGLGHAWYGTHSSLELVRVGSERHGLLHRIDDVHGGYEDKSAQLIFAGDGELAIQFVAPAVSGPGPGACGIPGEQHLRVTVDESTAPSGDDALFDVLVDARWNDADCRMLPGGAATFEGQVCQRVTRYRHVDGAYALLATERDECVALPTGVISGPG